MRWIPGSIGFAIAGRPDWCVSSIRTGMRSFPACPNSGQYRVTGASRSTSPASTCRSSAIELIAFPTDQHGTIVSRSHGCVRAASRHPAHRSTTGTPSRTIETAAPTSPRSAKLRTNSSRTRANRGSQSPWIAGTSAIAADCTARASATV